MPINSLNRVARWIYFLGLHLKLELHASEPWTFAVVLDVAWNCLESCNEEEVYLHFGAQPSQVSVNSIPFDLKSVRKDRI